MLLPWGAVATLVYISFASYIAFKTNAAHMPYVLLSSPSGKRKIYLSCVLYFHRCWLKQRDDVTVPHSNENWAQRLSGKLSALVNLYMLSRVCLLARSPVRSFVRSPVRLHTLSRAPNKKGEQVTSEYGYVSLCARLAVWVSECV